MNKEESQKIQIDFLLADFNSIKSEISRRSDQQKTAYLLYMAAISWMFTKIVSNEPHFSYMLVTWLVAFFAKMFIDKEGLEIGRLGKIIRVHICGELKKITDIDGAYLIPSENISIKEDDVCTRYHTKFNFITYFLIPIVISLYILYVKYNILF